MNGLSIDLTRERGLTAAQAAKFFPGYRGGPKAHPSRIIRYILDGVPLRNGRRCRLAAVRVGGGWVTSVEAIQRFIAEQQPEAAEGVQPEVVRPPSARLRAAEAASAELQRLGC